MARAPATAQVPATTSKADYGAVALETHGGGAILRLTSLQEVVDMANLMAKADVAVPAFLRGCVGACVSVVMYAQRWEMDPFAVANKSYSVNDRLAFEAQLVAAVVNMRAPIQGRPDYEYMGDGPSRQCKVTCVMEDGEIREYTSPRFDKITVKNSPLWKTDPDQQLGYYSIRSWARRHTPEVLLGVYTKEELEEAKPLIARDVTPKSTGMRERLIRHANAEGFNPAHIDRELASAQANRPAAEETAPHDPETGEVIEVEVEVEESAGSADSDECQPAGEMSTEADDVNRTATLPLDDFPGDRDFDVVAWAEKLEGDLLGYIGVDPLREDWLRHKDLLQKRAPEVFRRVNKAVAGRAADIAAGSISEPKA